jgi:transposase
MRKDLFWLSDEQWKRIEPQLPTDVRGVERVDDRRVISGIVHVLKSGCRWCDCPPSMARRQRSITASYGGQSAGSGKIYSGSLLGTDDRQTPR